MAQPAKEFYGSGNNEAENREDGALELKQSVESTIQQNFVINSFTTINEIITWETPMVVVADPDPAMVAELKHNIKKLRVVIINSQTEPDVVAAIPVKEVKILDARQEAVAAIPKHVKRAIICDKTTKDAISGLPKTVKEVVLVDNPLPEVVHSINPGVNSVLISRNVSPDAIRAIVAMRVFKIEHTNDCYVRDPAMIGICAGASIESVQAIYIPDHKLVRLVGDVKPGIVAAIPPNAVVLIDDDTSFEAMCAILASGNTIGIFKYVTKLETLQKIPKTDTLCSYGYIEPWVIQNLPTFVNTLDFRTGLTDISKLDMLLAIQPNISCISIARGFTSETMMHMPKTIKQFILIDRSSPEAVAAIPKHCSKVIIDLNAMKQIYNEMLIMLSLALAPSNDWETQQWLDFARSVAGRARNVEELISIAISEIDNPQQIKLDSLKKSYISLYPPQEILNAIPKHVNTAQLRGYSIPTINVPTLPPHIKIVELKKTAGLAKYLPDTVQMIIIDKHTRKDEVAEIPAHVPKLFISKTASVEAIQSISKNHNILLFADIANDAKGSILIAKLPAHIRYCLCLKKLDEQIVRKFSRHIEVISGFSDLAGMLAWQPEQIMRLAARQHMATESKDEPATGTEMPAVRLAITGAAARLLEIPQALPVAAVAGSAGNKSESSKKKKHRKKKPK